MSTDRENEHPTAREIIEPMLRRTADAILANDFSAMDACFQVPFIIETQDSKILVDSREKHRELFMKLVEGYLAKGVTEIVRICEDAAFTSSTVIRSFHTSHIMAGNLRVEDPIMTLATTELFADGWRITRAQYAAERVAPIGKAIEKYADKGE